MASTHKHIRSGTANKRPTTAIADGQIALNTNLSSPGLFFKDSTGAEILKIGPVHVGATAPNASPAGSAGNSTGEIWLDTSLTPVGVKIWNGSAFVNATPIGSTTVQGLLELATDAETQAGADTARAVTSASLQSKLSDSTSTTSNTTIASSTAVKAAYDLANAALPKTGGTVTGNLEIGTAGSLTFEGATADGFETTIAITDPTADRTITLPNTTGTVVTTGDSGTVTSTMLLDGTILNSDVNASAAIAGTKISPDFGAQTIVTTGVHSAALGAAATPSITFTGDLNTGIYSPGADQLAVATNGTGRLFVDASGNVGIGTSTPNTNVYGGTVLGLYGAGNNGGNIWLTSEATTAGNRTGRIGFGTEGNTSNKETARIWSLTEGSTAGNIGGNLVFNTKADGAGLTERLRITGAGLVGIGTTNPKSILTTQGNIVGLSATTHSLQHYQQAASIYTVTSIDSVITGASGSLVFKTGTNWTNGDAVEAARIRPDGMFEVKGAGTAGSSPAFSVNGSAPANSAIIDTSGRLLVGTIASPAHQLQVSTDSAGKPSTNTWTIVSDERIKEEIELADLDLCYQAVKTIPLKRFKWKDEVYTEEQVRDRRKLGWIAQDVEAVFPKAVGTYEFKYNQVFEETIIPAVEEVLDDEGNVTTPAQPERIEKGELISEDVIEDCRDLNSDQLYAAMYGAIQKLMVKVETLETKLAALKAS